jgi:hypothetical protein
MTTLPAGTKILPASDTTIANTDGNFASTDDNFASIDKNFASMDDNFVGRYNKNKIKFKPFKMLNSFQHFKENNKGSYKLNLFNYERFSSYIRQRTGNLVYQPHYKSGHTNCSA